MADKWLCLDYGEKRVGVAVGLADAGGREVMVFPRPAIIRSTRQVFFDELLALIAVEKPVAVVLGLPLRQDGSESLTTRQARNFAASLKRRCALPLYFMDETLSSAEAESLLREGGWKGGGENGSDGRWSGAVDSQAAAGILQSFLALAPERRVPVI